jgi:WD40 repeat protein
VCWLRWLLICLTTFSMARAGERPKPILVLDSGGHTASLKKVICTPDGKQLITVSHDKTVRVWDVDNGQSVRIIRPHIGPGREGLLDSGAISPDGRILALSWVEGVQGRAGLIHLVDFSRGRAIGVLKGHTDTVGSMAFSPDGKRLVSASSDRTARIWNLETRQTEHILKGHEHRVVGVAFSPDGKRLVTASYDRTARVWLVESGKCQATLTGHPARRVLRRLESGRRDDCYR